MFQRAGDKVPRPEGAGTEVTAHTHMVDSSQTFTENSTTETDLARSLLLNAIHFRVHRVNFGANNSAQSN